MTLLARYALGVAVVSLSAIAVTAAVPSESRGQVAWGAAAGVILQTPLGWLALRSLGTDRFLPVWGAGMLLRITAVLLAGVVLAPALGHRVGAMLGAMVAVLVALLLVEGVTALRDHSREDQR